MNNLNKFNALLARQYSRFYEYAAEGAGAAFRSFNAVFDFLIVLFYYFVTGAFLLMACLPAVLLLAPFALLNWIIKRWQNA
jgi:hypothetical protein